MLVHLVSSEQDDVAAAYRAIRAELSAFGHGLLEKEELIVLSKADLLDPAERERKLEELRATWRERQARLWAAYKPGYERYLEPATTQEAP